MAIYSKPQEANPYIIFDFETGGLSSNDNPVTEIAMIAIKGDHSLDEIARYSALVQPYDDKLIYDERALKITNLSHELLIEEGILFDEMIDGVIKLLRTANKQNTRNSPGLRPVLVGHNVGFDINFLHHIFERKFPQDKMLKKSGKIKETSFEALLHGRTDHFGNFQPSYVDTWSLSKMWFGGLKELPNFQLSTVVEKAGIEITDAHRAMNDVIATTELFRAVMRNLRSNDEDLTDQPRNKRKDFRFPI